MASGIKVTKNFTGMDRIIRDTPERCDRAIRGAAQAVTSEIVVSFPPGPGPSAPGGVPHVQIGTLRLSMRWEPDGPRRAIVMDQTEYGALLEMGTSKMAPRPFFAPVFHRWGRGGELEKFLRDWGLIV